MGGRGTKSKTSAAAPSGDAMQQVTDQNTALRRDQSTAVDNRRQAESAADSARRVAPSVAEKYARVAGNAAEEATKAAQSALVRAERIQKLADSLRSHPNQFFRDSSAAQAASAQKHAQQTELAAKGARKSARGAYRAARLSVPDYLKD